MVKSIARTVSSLMFLFVSVLAASAAVVTQAVDVAVDQNNNSYMLLLNSDGSNTLNRIDPSGTLTFTATYGPYSGETASALSVGQDGKVRILWVSNTHNMTVWAVTLTAGVTPHYSPFYGPYTSPSGSQYNPIGIATGSDNLTRVLWASTDGYCTFWTLDESGHAAYSHNYYPDPHYNAIGIAAGNGTVRLLWRKNDNTTTFWIVPSTISSTGSVTFGAALPPPTGFYPTDIGLDGNNTVYILFNNPSGQTNLWSIASGNTSTAPTTSSFYSLYHNWAADKIATSNVSASASNLRLLWSNTGDTSTLWNLSSVASVGGVTTGGLVTSSSDFGPVSTQTVGTNSDAPLLAGNEGLFYGTTVNGGLNNHGTIFRTDTNGNTKAIYTFGSQPDGFGPVAALIRSADGSMYGTTFHGGVNGTGTVYKISPYGVETILHGFQVDSSPYSEGTYPHCRLLLNASGILIGTTTGGGQNNQGTVFSINPSGAGFSTVHSFSAFVDGQSPSEGLIQVAGNFLNAYYGSCPGGGTGAGTVFRISPDLSTVSVLKSFDGSSEGNTPNSELTYVSANNSLYGVTTIGGDISGSTYGVIYRIDGNGNFSNVHSFIQTDGQNPSKGPLYVSSAGYLYGTTNVGGANGKGVIYSLNFSNNAYTLLHSFTSTDGANPNGGLTSGADGQLYSTTQNGGANGYGTAFKTTTAGAVTITHSF